jgi:aminotransferase protein U homolog (nitrogenfixation protein nifU)
LASVDLAIDLFINKQKEEIIELLDIYFKMINTSQIADKDYEKLGALAVFKNVKNNFNRLECASIIYRAFRKEII